MCESPCSRRQLYTCCTFFKTLGRILYLWVGLQYGMVCSKWLSRNKRWCKVCKVAPQNVNVERKIKATVVVAFVVVIVIVFAWVSKKKVKRLSALTYLTHNYVVNMYNYIVFCNHEFILFKGALSDLFISYLSAIY